MPLPHQLTYRQVNQEPPGYRISYDGVEVGSISMHNTAGTTQRWAWRWGVDTMPLMSGGGNVPSGDADSFEQALAKFKAAFTIWMNGLHPGDWQRNRDLIRAGIERLRARDAERGRR